MSNLQSYTVKNLFIKTYLEGLLDKGISVFTSHYFISRDKLTVKFTLHEYIEVQITANHKISPRTYSSDSKCFGLIRTVIMFSPARPTLSREQPPVSLSFEN